MSSSSGGGLGVSVKLSKSLPFRDKSVKTLQYACRFLLGIYAGNLNAKSAAVLQTVVGQCSQGRKVFRLLKSVNMLQSIVAKSGEVMENGDEVRKLLGIDDGEANSVVGYRQLAKYFEYLELIFIGIYFGLDNILFLGRATIIPKEVYSPQARKWERATFSVWLANDISCFIKIILQISATNIEIQSNRRAIVDGMNRALEVPKSASRDDGEEATKPMKLDHVDVADIDGDTLAEATASSSVNANRMALRQLYGKRRGHFLQLFKNLCDLGVSSGNLMVSSSETEAYRWWDRNTPLVRILGNDVSIGLLGALSSIADITTMV